MSTTSLLRQEELHPGYQLKAYTLLERLGYGGHATVWSAWDRDHERVVAIKILLTTVDAPLLDKHAFQREAHIVSGLSHPNILPLYDFESISTYRYLSMRYICSGSLQDWISSGPIPLPEVLRLAAQIAAALEYIHEHNIVHRDLKPANILLDTRKRVYVTDFGLAKRLSPTTAALHTGQGTAPYAPPEQVTMARLDPRSDIYSMGILLFEALTGKLPWDGFTSLAIRQIEAAEELPDPRTINSSLPDGLGPVLRHLTASAQTARPHSASVAFNLVAGVLAEGEGRNATLDLSKPALENVLGLPPPLEASVAPEVEDARYLVRQGTVDWDPGGGNFGLSLTDFALADSVYSQAERHGIALDDSLLQFMLRGALAHGRSVNYWWQQLADPQARARVCEQTISLENEVAAGRAVERILGDTALAARPELFSPSTIGSVLDLASETEDPAQRDTALALTNRLAPIATRWHSGAVASPSDMKLADLALGNGLPAKQAARLIGRLRSEAAVSVLLGAQGESGTDGILPAIVEVRDVAGSLPRSVPVATRLRVVARLARRQLTADSVSLLRAYLAAALGGALGLGLHIYATYRVPGFLDAARILNAVGGGLLFGLLIGLGIFLTRLIVRRLRILSSLPRMVLAVGLGASIVNFGLVSYHTLFLAAAPEGWWIASGSILTVLGFAVGAEFIRSRQVRAFISAATIGLGLTVSWQAAVRTSLTPMLYYEVGRPVQTTVLVAATSILVGFVAHGVDP